MPSHKMDRVHLVALHGYPRWDNPYAHTEFGSQQFHIEFKGKSLDLDFQNGVRAVH